MELILLSLVGVSVAGFLFNQNGDAANDSAEDGNGSGGQPTDDGPGEIVLASGTPNPQGSDRDDRFTGIAEGEVRGFDGDDRFDIAAGYGARIEGGRGDDTIRASQTDSSEFYGGEGNDDISFDTSVFDGAAAYGGKGDDRFELDFETGKTLATVSLRGGSGEDTFDLGFTSGAEGDTRTVVLDDFSPDEDTLTVRVGDFTSANLIEGAGGSYTDLVLQLDTQTATLRLTGASGLTLVNDESGTVRVLG